MREKKIRERNKKLKLSKFEDKSYLPNLILKVQKKRYTHRYKHILKSDDLFFFWFLIFFNSFFKQKGLFIIIYKNLKRK